MYNRKLDADEKSLYCVEQNLTPNSVTERKMIECPYGSNYCVTITATSGQAELNKKRCVPQELNDKCESVRGIFVIITRV